MRPGAVFERHLVTVVILKRNRENKVFLFETALYGRLAVVNGLPRVVRELTRALALSFQAKIWKFIGFYN